MSQSAIAGACPDLIVTTPKVRQSSPANDNELRVLLRVAAEQWPKKSPEDQQHERRFIARDLAAFESRRADNDNNEQ